MSTIQNSIPTKTWNVEKLKILFNIIIKVQTQTKGINVNSDQVLKLARKEPIFSLNTDQGIVRAIQRLSNAVTRTEWESDSRSRMCKYYQAIGIDIAKLPPSAVNKQAGLSAHDAKLGHRKLGEIVDKTSFRFPLTGAYYDASTRAIETYKSVVRDLEMEMSAMTPEQREKVEAFLEGL